MLLKAADKGSTQVMECLNTDNASKSNIGKKRRAVGQKPSSLQSANMKKPVAVPQAGVQLEDKENAADNNNQTDAAQQPATAQQKQENEDSSEAEFECLACGS